MNFVTKLRNYYELKKKTLKQVMIFFFKRVSSFLFKLKKKTNLFTFTNNY